VLISEQIFTVPLKVTDGNALRHAHATLMLSAGVHPKVVSERLGHASVGITLDTCSHVLPGLQAAAAAAQLDALLGASNGGETAEIG
jgi:integrase